MNHAAREVVRLRTLTAEVKRKMREEMFGP
jgi:hypothetical protein